MADTLLERHRFFQPLHELFTDDTQEWFIGVDRMIDDMSKKWEEALKGFNDFPTSKVERLNDKEYRINLHLPGYDKGDLKVRLLHNDELVVSGEAKRTKGEKAEHASFEQRFLLADTMQVDSAKFVNGDLVIDVSFPETAETHETSVPIA